MAAERYLNISFESSLTTKIGPIYVRKKKHSGVQHFTLQKVPHAPLRVELISFGYSLLDHDRVDKNMSSRAIPPRNLRLNLRVFAYSNNKNG